MTDSSEIGRYGTLRLLKRHEPETTVAFFPIDEETVTFGRSKECSVRLYYDCVSELHCTLQFSEEHKAFLRVQGTNGLLVDGCQVNPSGPSAGPTTVPLSNGSEIEIYKKRFKFEYPPKEVRAALLATPRNAKSRRSLRMSMIRSAQVFTPRVNAQNLPRTPRRGSIRDNIEWEALRSPVKVPSQDTGMDEEMLLLEGQGDDAVVVEEEKDIIILQQVGNDIMENSVASSRSKPQTRPARSVAFSIPSSTPPPKHVPVAQSVHAAQKVQPSLGNRRRSAPSLHRAVVLRSAQRALEREREKFEEELEEDEVEAEVSPERELGPLEANSNEEEADDGVNDEDQEEDREPQPIVPSNALTLPPGRRMSVFKASLEAMRKVIPVSPFVWKAPEEVPLPDDEGDRNEDDAELEQNEAGDDLDTNAELRTPIRRNFGPFMTPQVQVHRPAQRVPVDAKARASIGGEGIPQRTFGGAQRVRVVPAWKVKDIVLPEPEKQSRLEQQQQEEVKKERISEEERRAIMERRKSAVHIPSSLPMPGPRSSMFLSPQGSDAYTPGESDEDAETMLEKMRQKMDHVKRKSEARRVRMSVGGHQQGEDFSLLAPGVERSDRMLIGTGPVEETLSQMKRAEPTGSHLDGPPLEVTDSKPGPKDQDELNLLDVSSDDDESPRRGAEQVASGPNGNSSSLTPRFDGVREMFRRTPLEPKTPSFAGFRKMFHERSQAPPKTPSFRGVREMFNRAYAANVPATPHLSLGDMFDEEEYDDREDTTGDSADTRQSITMDSPEDDHEGLALIHANETSDVKSEDEDAVVPTPAPKKTTRTRKTTTSSTKKPSRKKDIPVVDIPTAVAEEEDSGEEESGETEPTPPLGTRRPMRRAAKTTATPGTDEPSGRGGSRSTKKVATAMAQSTSKGIVVHKSTRARRFVEVESENEESTKSTRKGRGRAKPSNQETSENDAEQEQEAKAPAKQRSGSRKAKAAIASDSEEVEPPKPRRGRPVKTPQALDDIDEDAYALTTTTKAARTKIDDGPDVAPAAKAPKSRRGGKIKVAEVVDNEDTVSPEIDDHQSELEEITPAPRKGRVAKASAQKKTLGLKDGMSDDKENSGDQQPKSTGKTPAVRTRKTPATTPLEADVPAKRTRSRK